MNPLMLYRSLPYIIIVVLAAALAWTTNLYLGKRDQLAALTASVQALGQAAEARVAEVKKQSEENLKTVKEDHEKLAPAIRAGAVRNYLAAHPKRVRVVHAGSGSVPRDAPREQVDDGGAEKPVLDEAFIADAADDANKLAAWQQWCQLNRCPVKD